MSDQNRPDTDRRIMMSWGHTRDEILADTRLSFEALGLLLTMRTRPDDTPLLGDILESRRMHSPDSAAKALHELEAHGYIRRGWDRGYTCWAYRDDGTICRQPAHHLDARRWIMVCDEHHNL